MAAGVAACAGVALQPAWLRAPHGKRIRLRELALQIWGVVLGVSVAIVSYGIYRKSQQTQTRLRGAAGAQAALESVPGAVCRGHPDSACRAQRRSLGWLPAIWLGCYGAAITNGGQVSVAPVRYLGLCLLATAAGGMRSWPQDFGSGLAGGRIRMAAPGFRRLHRLEAQWLRKAKDCAPARPTNWIR